MIPCVEVTDNLDPVNTCAQAKLSLTGKHYLKRQHPFQDTLGKLCEAFEAAVGLDTAWIGLHPFEAHCRRKGGCNPVVNLAHTCPPPNKALYA